MKALILACVMTLALRAGVLDPLELLRAERAYLGGEYEKAYDHFSRIQNRSDTVIYNMANSLYKAKRYDEAIALYNQIQDATLGFQKFHNIGNSYVGLGDCASAVNHYEMALGFAQSEETKYNLGICRKWLEDEKNKEPEPSRGKGERDVFSDLTEGEEGGYGEGDRGYHSPAGAKSAEEQGKSPRARDRAAGISGKYPNPGGKRRSVFALSTTKMGQKRGRGSDSHAAHPA